MLQFNPKPGDTIVTRSTGNFICKDKKPWQDGYDFYGCRTYDLTSWTGWHFNGSTYDNLEDFQVVEIIPAQKENTMQTTKPHKHAELIKAWADGAEIQVKCCGIWHDYSGGDSPIWCPDHEYRIKPEVKPDLVRYYKAIPGSTVNQYNLTKDSNLKLVFDANTGELKSAEVI